MTIRRHLGKRKRGIQNWMSEQRHGPDARFAYDYADLEDFMRVSFCSMREVGMRTRCMISERIIEYPLVFQKVVSPGCRILDIGSAESFLPYQLASLGNDVVASDLFPPNQQWAKRKSQQQWSVREDWSGYLFRHPNLRFVREDATQLGHRDGCFDTVTAISTVEHFGCYGVRQADPVRVGLRAMSEMRRVLKPGGLLLLSVPYGTGGDSPRNHLLQMIFDASLLNTYVAGFEIVEQRYFLYRDVSWVESTEAIVATSDCSTRTMGMCFVEARKARN